MVSRGHLVASATGVKWMCGTFNGKACHSLQENSIFLSVYSTLPLVPV